MIFNRCLIACLAACLLGGCESSRPAPIVSEDQVVSVDHNTLKTHYYFTQTGDTIYSIAYAYDVDYRTLIQANHLKAPYHLGIGNQVMIPPATTSASTQQTTPEPHHTPSPTSHSTAPSATHHTPTWDWPATQWVKRSMHRDVNGRWGIYLTPAKKASMHAVASGTVVYVGTKIRGFTDVVIIKHNDNWLSAYVNLSQPSVKLNQAVTPRTILGTISASGVRNQPFRIELISNGRPIYPQALYHLKSHH